MKRTKKATKKTAKKATKKSVKRAAKKSPAKKRVTGKVVKKKVSTKKLVKKVSKKTTGKVAAKKKATKKNVAKKTPAKKPTPKKSAPKKATKAAAPAVKVAAPKQHPWLGKQVPTTQVHLVQKNVPSKIADLQELVGNGISVLYFYPKDDTPGCTTEACEFGDRLQDFVGLGAQVIGVSPDAEDSHVKFIEKYNIPFALISDVNQELSNKLNVWKEKNFMGKSYMGIERATFLLKDGFVVSAWQPVSVAGHVAEVHQKISELKG